MFGFTILHQMPACARYHWAWSLGIHRLKEADFASAIRSTAFSQIELAWCRVEMKLTVCATRSKFGVVKGG